MKKQLSITMILWYEHAFNEIYADMGGLNRAFQKEFDLSIEDSVRLSRAMESVQFLQYATPEEVNNLTKHV